MFQINLGHIAYKTALIEVASGASRANLIFSLDNLKFIPYAANLFVERIPSKVEGTCNLERRGWVNQIH